MTTATLLCPRQFEVGERIRWFYRSDTKATRGVVVAIDHGGDVGDYGRLCRIRCDVSGCPCNTSDWTHACNDVQLTLDDAAAEGRLW